jgi:transposase-like protein
MGGSDAKGCRSCRRRGRHIRLSSPTLAHSERSVKDVAESLGCSDQSLHLWVKRDQLDRHERDDGLTSAERDELRNCARQTRN